ncbi:alkaline shock response membrane anchor protein AmaP [Corynebacterium sp. zg-331]|uniref:alkaline shock response membrane anchor protein AmaP n=1 Tax=unclassified Corynebacterium TaxID=2624378 RepID=UPI00128D81E7|nr:MULTISPECIES: alkaline shock response membrane anchor protein AmaP [unclassified Corynebacterium]MBC3186056.1 alkaline shock response membrane anchor protein AmaP [Corynebacterium sp. zg-331]MPV52546.1 alkaline shock response membrane anchor protein AmaP [Corynebacterium sp. zg331]
MSRALSAVDRIILVFFGLLGLLGGAWGIASWLRVEQVSRVNRRIDASVFSTVQDSPWFTAALWITMILGVILGLWWIAANLRRRGFNRLRSEASTAHGSIDISLVRVASAVGEDLSEVPGVTRVRHRVAMERSRPTITWMIRGEAITDLLELREAIERNEEDLRAALPGIDVDSVYKINLAPVAS